MCDAELTCTVATVSVTVTPVNDAPVATNDAAATDEDTPLSVPAPGVLGNDSDVDGDTLSAVVVDGPTHRPPSRSTRTAPSTTRPTPTSTGPTPSPTRRTTASLNSNTATVTITVNSVNDAPVATDDSATTNEDTALTVTAPGVLANDGDADGDTLSAALVTDVAHGTLALAADGSFTYTPAANFNGTDTFTYTASDGSVPSTLATVTITVNPVNDAPVAADDVASTNEDTALHVDAPGLLANDTDVENSALTAAVVTGPTHPPTSTSTPTARSTTRRRRTSTGPTRSPTGRTTGPPTRTWRR